jgi:8-oxo-dGTP diphosphatase
MTEDMQPTTRVSAYGLCFDEADRMLLVRIAPGFTRDSEGRWTLPGGGLNFGEDPEAGALREVEEETGYTGEIVRLAFVNSWSRGPLLELGYGPYYGVRIVYFVRITGGGLRHEVDESTDMAAWFTREELRTTPLVELVDRALEYLDAEHALAH